MASKIVGSKAYYYHTLDILKVENLPQIRDMSVNGDYFEDISRGDASYTLVTPKNLLNMLNKDYEGKYPSLEQALNDLKNTDIYIAFDG